MHSQQPPGVVQNWSTLQCSKQNTEQCGYDHAPVTRGRMRAQFPLPHGQERERARHTHTEREREGDTEREGGRDTEREREWARHRERERSPQSERPERERERERERQRPAEQGLETNRHCGRVVGASLPKCTDGQGQSTISSHPEWYRTGLRCSAARQNTELCGDDHAPVTRGRMRAQYPLPHGPQYQLKC